MMPRHASTGGRTHADRARLADNAAALAARLDGRTLAALADENVGTPEQREHALLARFGDADRTGTTGGTP